MEWKRTPVDMVDEQRRHLYNPAARQMNDNAQLQLINLPDVCLEAILSNLSYDEISKYRIVRSFFSIRKHSLSFCHVQRSIDFTMWSSGLQTIRSDLQEAAQSWLQSHGEVSRTMSPHCQKQVAKERVGATESPSRSSLRYLNGNRNENLYVINDFYQVRGPERLLLYSRKGNGFFRKG